MARIVLLTGLVFTLVLAMACARRPAPEQELFVEQVQAVETPEPLPPEGGSVAFPGEPLARWGDPRLRHIGQVQKVVFRPDGKALAASEYNSSIIIEWDADNGRELRRYSDSEKPARYAMILGYTPNGRRLIIDSDYAQIVVFDTESGRVVSRIKHLREIAICPDGTTIAGRSPDRRATVWDLETGQPVRTYPTDVSGGLSFSPDGKWLVACANGQYLMSDPTMDGRPSVRSEVWVGPADGSGPGRLLVPPDGGGDDHVRGAWVRSDRVVLMRKHQMISYDPATGDRKAIAKQPPQQIRDIFLADAGRLYVQEFGKDPVEFDIETLAPLVGGGKFPARDYWPARSPDGLKFAKSDGHAIQLFDAKTEKRLHPDRDNYPTRPAHTIQFSADGRRMLTVGYECIRVWDFPVGRPPTVIDPEGRTARSYYAHLSPDGRWVADCNDHSIAVFSAETGEVVFRQPPPPIGTSQRPRVVGFDPAGRLWVTDSWAGEITCHEVPSGQVVQTIKSFEQSVYMALSPDGRKLAVGGWKAFAVRDTDPAADWTIVERYPGRQPGGCGLDLPPCPQLFSFTRDSRRLITERGEFDMRNMYWEPAVAGKELPEAKEVISGPSKVYSPDGRRSVGASNYRDGTSQVRIWETASNTELARLVPRGGVSGLAFTPDGKRLVVAKTDTTFELWDYPSLEARLLTPIAGDNWQLLASPHAKVGLAVVDALIADPAMGLSLLKARLRPIDPLLVKKLIAELSDEDFATRERAGDDLAKLGSQAEGALREAAKSPSPEASRRAVRLLRGIKPSVRTIRAVEVVERIGTAEARDLLATWAKNNADVLLQAEARSALGRLKSQGR